MNTVQFGLIKCFHKLMVFDTQLDEVPALYNCKQIAVTWVVTSLVH